MGQNNLTFLKKPHFYKFLCWRQMIWKLSFYGTMMRRGHLTRGKCFSLHTKSDLVSFWQVKSSALGLRICEEKPVHGALRMCSWVSFVRPRWCTNIPITYCLFQDVCVYIHREFEAQDCISCIPSPGEKEVLSVCLNSVVGCFSHLS